MQFGKIFFRCKGQCIIKIPIHCTRIFFVEGAWVLQGRSFVGRFWLRNQLFMLGKNLAIHRVCLKKVALHIGETVAQGYVMGIFQCQLRKQ